jgi:hypothetical protein
VKRSPPPGGGSFSVDFPAYEIYNASDPASIKEEAMKAVVFYLHAMPVLLAALIALPSCESKVEIANTPPGNVTLVVSKCFIETGGMVGLGGGAIDDDGDPLTYRWAATAGTFTPATATGASIQWNAPETPGTVTIRMYVTDDIETVTKSQDITVCSPVQSSVTTSTTLANTGFVYIVKNADLLRISSAATLTIEPGVTIVFDVAAGGFESFGRIVAEGTPGEKIRFRGNSCGFSSGLWDGIYLDGEHSEAIFRNVELSTGSNGIQVINGAKLTLDRSAVNDNTNVGVSVLTEGSVAHILSSEIWDNGTGIEIENASVDITSSSVQYNTLNGIEISYSLSATDVRIDTTIIAGNGDNGILLSGLASPVIEYCSLYSNGEGTGEGSAIRLASRYGTDTISAQHNFWGAGNTTEQKIGFLIFDGHDEFGLAYVDFSNPLGASPEPPMTASMEGAKER